MTIGEKSLAIISVQKSIIHLLKLMLFLFFHFCSFLFFDFIQLRLCSCDFFLSRFFLLKSFDISILKDLMVSALFSVGNFFIDGLLSFFLFFWWSSHWFVLFICGEGSPCLLVFFLRRCYLLFLSLRLFYLFCSVWLALLRRFFSLMLGLSLMFVLVCLLVMIFLFLFLYRLNHLFLLMQLSIGLIKLLLSIHCLRDRLIFSYLSDMPRSDNWLVIFTYPVFLMLAF